VIPVVTIGSFGYLVLPLGLPAGQQGPFGYSQEFGTDWERCEMLEDLQFFLQYESLTCTYSLEISMDRVNVIQLITQTLSGNSTPPLAIEWDSGVPVASTPAIRGHVKRSLYVRARVTGYIGGQGTVFVTGRTR
jgi:hypothetical protein